MGVRGSLAMTVAFSWYPRGNFGMPPDWSDGRTSRIRRVTLARRKRTLLCRTPHFPLSTHLTAYCISSTIGALQGMQALQNTPDV